MGLSMTLLAGAGAKEGVPTCARAATCPGAVPETPCEAGVCLKQPGAPSAYGVGLQEPQSLLHGAQLAGVVLALLLACQVLRAASCTACVQQPSLSCLPCTAAANQLKVHSSVCVGGCYALQLCQGCSCGFDPGESGSLKNYELLAQHLAREGCAAMQGAAALMTWIAWTLCVGCPCALVCQCQHGWNLP